MKIMSKVRAAGLPVACLMLAAIGSAAHSGDWNSANEDTNTYPGATTRADTANFRRVQDTTSNRCLTPTFWCRLPSYAPVGTPCWCATPYGPVGGSVG